MKRAFNAHPAHRAMKRMRALMGWTQAETASFLGISEKSVQSYEQGWRNIPENLWKHFITLAAVQQGYPRGYRTCWEIMRCPPRIQARCFCARKMAGRFCWMTSESNCHRHHPELRRSMLTCLSCPVVQQFL